MPASSLAAQHRPTSLRLQAKPPKIPSAIRTSAAHDPTVAAGEVVPQAGQVQNSRSGQILQGKMFPNLRLISLSLFRYRSGDLMGVTERNLPYNSQMVLLYSWYFYQVTPRPMESAIR
jgi:hypothetical protein